jgi:hypothetical protein
LRAFGRMNGTAAALSGCLYVETAVIGASVGYQTL